ncbi:hypothetical protein FGG08_007020 [Glutinoglossum americanum]|uniref:RteC protein n=1 Tax=Glutinoglossum americanum TaxID=1670608 RepID=A0A9P8KWV2_9PEZI|nr:hypothetical protein FGG08_007020 [Glutinoglossum americanum]
MSNLTDRSGRLFTSMNEQLAQINKLRESPLNCAQKAVVVCNKTIKDLNEMVQNTPFTDKEEEINFFKAIKPRFTAELVYYAKLYQVHLHWPLGDENVHREYLRKTMRQFQQFFEDNFDFFIYWRTGSTDQDEAYFLRNDGSAYRVLPLPLYIKGDQCSTGYDLLVACILAFERLVDYLKEHLSPAQPPRPPQLSAAALQVLLNWTAEKVDFVELCYSLAESGALNNGEATLHDIFTMLGATFNIHIKDYARKWIDIRARKSDKPSFIEKLVGFFKKARDKSDGK